MGMLERRFPGRHSKQCKSPEEAAFLVCLKSNKVDQVTKKWWEKMDSGRRSGQGANRAKVVCLSGYGKNFSFYHEINKTVKDFIQMSNTI